MTENNTQHAPVRAAAPTTLTAEEIKAQLTESGIPEHLHSYFPRGLGELIPAMGIKFQELTAERTVATMPVAGNTQPIGLLHGGANVVLAETLGSLSAGVHGGEDLVAVGVDINATHCARQSPAWLPQPAPPSSSDAPYASTPSTLWMSAAAPPAPHASPTC